MRRLLKAWLVFLLLTFFAVFLGCKAGGDPNAFFNEVLELSKVQTDLVHEFSTKLEEAESGESVVSIFSQFMDENNRLSSQIEEIMRKYSGVGQDSMASVVSNRFDEFQTMQSESLVATVRFENAFFSNRHRTSPEMKNLFSQLSNQMGELN